MRLNKWFVNMIEKLKNCSTKVWFFSWLFQDYVLSSRNFDGKGTAFQKSTGWHSQPLCKQNSYIRFLIQLICKFQTNICQTKRVSEWVEKVTIRRK